jgi:polysaccharide biosynthesis protein PelF
MVAATRHGELALDDYHRLREVGIVTARDGFRWHLVDERGRLDLTSVVAAVRAAREADVQVIWDLCHYGWPDDVDVFGVAFVTRLAAFARAVACVVADETDAVPAYAPINEISYLAWAGGDAGYLNPFETGRGAELKRQLVRGYLAAVDELRAIDPRTRVVAVEPRTHLADPAVPDADRDHREWECEAWDMIAGRRAPELGGAEDYLDLVGINYYPGNQFLVDGTRISRFHPLYRPPREIFAEVIERYVRPTFLAETCASGEHRPEWLGYIADEARHARADGMSLDAICLYPIVDHPGWDDDRPWEVGLWSYPDDRGNRAIHGAYREQLRVEHERSPRRTIGSHVNLPTQIPAARAAVDGPR